MDGVLNINKPPGMTSHDVVLRVRRILKEKRIGHTGTLDPLATGVLVLCVGKATRIAQYLEAGEKEYRAIMRLGVTTDTLDAEGRVLETRPHTHPDREKIIEVMRQFTGSIMQQPPAYSAVKVSGVPSYKLARAGKAGPLASRPVTIFTLELTSYEHPLVGFTVRCSKGVYVRTLCADMGETLGMGAHLTSLVRTCSGGFSLDRAITLDALAETVAAGDQEQALISIDEALADFPAVLLNEQESLRVMHGNQISCPEKLANSAKDRVRLHDSMTRLIAIARVDAGVIKPELVFSYGS
jgi:tRNA pseudouridine55 synthase